MSERWRKQLPGLLDDQSGQAATEYILVLGLVAIPLVAAYDAMQNSIREMLDRISKLLRGPGI